MANLVTHVGAIVSLVEDFKSSHWWTFVRTCIWLLLSLRLLWSAAAITKALSHVSQHLNYLWSVGQLQGNSEEWQRFFKLVETFQLGTKTYGFPLTLKQAASIYCNIYQLCTYHSTINHEAICALSSRGADLGGEE